MKINDIMITEEGELVLIVTSVVLWYVVGLLSAIWLAKWDCFVTNTKLMRSDVPRTSLLAIGGVLVLIIASIIIMSDKDWWYKEL